jgi:hypothetical protein
MWAKLMLAVALIHFGDASRTNYWRYLLPFGKPSSPIAIDVNAREFFAVTVVHGNSPVPMLAAPVAMDATVRIRFGSCPACFLGHWNL